MVCAVRHFNEVKDHPEAFVETRDLDLAALHPTDVDVIGKVNGTRRVRRDATVLGARLGEDQYLRLDRNLEAVEQLKENFAVGPAGGKSLFLRLRDEAGHPVIGLGLVVEDGGPFVDGFKGDGRDQGRDSRGHEQDRSKLFLHG